MKTKLIALTALTLLTASACGGGGSPEDTSGSDGQGTPSSSSGAEVAIATFNYQPKELEVKAGETVTWTNEDDILHTVTSGKQREQAVPGAGEDTESEADGTFDGDLDGAGTTFSFTFEEAGEYAYFCEVHVAMTGTVIVSE